MNTVWRHFQEFHFPVFAIVSITHKGTKMSSGFAPNPTVSLSSFISASAKHDKTANKKCWLSITTVTTLFTACRRDVCPDWLLLVDVSKRMPACRLLLLVHHKEKWRKRLDQERTEQSISAVVTLKAADISCCCTLLVCWGPDSSDPPPSRVVDLSFIKMERGFTRLKEIQC